MRGFTGGLAEVQAHGTTVREVIDDLDSHYPGLKTRLMDDDRLKPNIALVVDGVSSRQGLRQAVSESSEVHFVPAISGGRCGSHGSAALPPFLGLLNPSTNGAHAKPARHA